MIELLFVLAMIGWAVGSFIEFLASLEAFPTLVAMAIVVPLACLSIRSKVEDFCGARYLRQRRPMLPPERFLWTIRRRWLARAVAACWLLVVPVTAAAIAWPARFEATPVSLAGWISGALAAAAWALACVLLAVYVQASQRYDRLTPAIIGGIRRAMFYLSDNYEFLGEEPEAERRKRRLAVY